MSEDMDARCVRHQARLCGDRIVTTWRCLLTKSVPQREGPFPCLLEGFLSSHFSSARTREALRNSISLPVPSLLATLKPVPCEGLPGDSPGIPAAFPCCLQHHHAGYGMPRDPLLAPKMGCDSTRILFSVPCSAGKIHWQPYDTYCTGVCMELIITAISLGP